MEDVDQIIDLMDKEVEGVMRRMYDSSSKRLEHPFVYGFSMRMSPKGEPIIRTFGDRSLRDRTFREPVYEQVVDEEKGELRLFVELPGVEKEDVRLKCSPEEVAISAQRGEQKYDTSIKLNIPIEPGKTTASCRNGVLEVILGLRDKANKDYTKIGIE